MSASKIHVYLFVARSCISAIASLPEDDFRRRLPRFQQNALRANLTIAGRVREIAERTGVTPAQVALAWVVAQGECVVPIPGTKTPKYLVDNAGAADIELTSADLVDLDVLPTPQGPGTDSRRCALVSSSSAKPGARPRSEPFDGPTCLSEGAKQGTNESPGLRFRRSGDRSLGVSDGT
jgi:hypothetical protein